MSCVSSLNHPLHWHPWQPWSWPTRPWSRLHIDYAGPVDGKMFLIVIDAHSKWLEVLPVQSATSFCTIQQLRQLFSRFGIPDSLVSDNGTPFTSKEFEDFCKSNGIRHIRVAPYHPASNGLAERAVRIIKEGLKKQKTKIDCQRYFSAIVSHLTRPQILHHQNC